MNLVATLLEDAVQAVASARLLLGAGDIKGACNRAYYAMFNAARAALAVAGQPPEAVKTHARLIGEFGRVYVKPGIIPRELGKALNDIEEIRLAADYAGIRIGLSDAAWATEQAEQFLAAVRPLIEAAQR